jgi:hypothetical protein
MASYVPGNVAIQGFAAPTLETVELRVISNLLQTSLGQVASPTNTYTLDDLARLRNDQAFELGIVPPVVPGN